MMQLELLVGFSHGLEYTVNSPPSTEFLGNEGLAVIM
jgi:hypothetical protein